MCYLLCLRLSTWRLVLIIRICKFLKYLIETYVHKYMVTSTISIYDHGLGSYVGRHILVFLDADLLFEVLN